MNVHLSAYSVFLEHIVELGYIGFTCFVWLIIVTLNYGITQVNRLRKSQGIKGLWVIGAIAAMVGLMTHGMVDTVWYRPEVATVWWLMVAVVFSYVTRSFSSYQEPENI